MKLYRVTTERDGATVKAPGVSETEIRREVTYYLANSIERVWDAIYCERSDPEQDVMEIAECLPMVQVLQDEEVS